MQTKSNSRDNCLWDHHHHSGDILCTIQCLFVCLQNVNNELLSRCLFGLVEGVTTQRCDQHWKHSPTDHKRVFWGYIGIGRVVVHPLSCLLHVEHSHKLFGKFSTPSVMLNRIVSFVQW